MAISKEVLDELITYTIFRTFRELKRDALIWLS